MVLDFDPFALLVLFVCYFCYHFTLVILLFCLSFHSLVDFSDVLLAFFSAVLFWGVLVPPNTHTHTHARTHACTHVHAHITAMLKWQCFLLQDAIDLFLGNHIVEETEGLTTRSPLAVQRDWKFYAVSIFTDLPLWSSYNLHSSETPLTQAP